MTNKFTRIAMFLVFIASVMVVGCSERKNDAQEQLQIEKPETGAQIGETPSEEENSKVDESTKTEEYVPVEMSERELDSLVDLKVKKAMEKDPFRTMAEEQKRYNDSLDQIKGNKFPHKPGPEGVLKLLYRNCLKKRNCPNE